MTRGEYIRSLPDNELPLYLYLNRISKDSLSIRKIAEWVEEEIKPEEEKK